MDRRGFMAMAAGSAALMPTAAVGLGSIAPAARGSVDAGNFGIDADAGADQSRALQTAIDASAREDKPVYLPPGRYVVSQLDLPANTRLVGVAGASRLVFGGGAYMIRCDGAAFVQLADLVIDGAGRRFDTAQADGLVHLANVADLAVTGCSIVDSSGAALAVNRSGGRIDGNRIDRAAGIGLRLVESTGLTVSDNRVLDCGDGGIAVLRWRAGEDATAVTGNRIERIAARSGGTGQNGNGINVFRAHNVIVSGNRIVDCAFAAVRASAADNVQILGNSCSASAEAAICSEFGSQGAVIGNNVIDGAGAGIVVTNFEQGGRMAVVSANLVRNVAGGDKGPVSLGVGISVQADAAVTGNVIDGAERFGLVLGQGPHLRDIAATGNVIRGAPIGVAVSVVEGSGSVVVTDNLISGASRGNVVGMRWGERGSGDLTLPDAQAFPHVLVDRNRVS